MESELSPGGRGELRLTNHRPEIAFANLSSLLMIFLQRTGAPLVAFISGSRLISRGTLP
ncbi:hypothetical protein BDV93DRAFT_529862 [Ceratobasidium sp. AG-I]|nr:hypothetical protein BDV93DRAFT_529862 [Ceratobasidium sp. AG-I]